MVRAARRASRPPATPATAGGGTRERGEGGRGEGRDHHGDKDHEGDDDSGFGWRTFFGFLVNAFGAATESADTRSWLVLPDEISVARIPVDAGTHRVSWRFLDPNGRRVSAAMTDGVTVRPGGMAFVVERTYR